MSHRPSGSDAAANHNLHRAPPLAPSSSQSQPRMSSSRPYPPQESSNDSQATTTTNGSTDRVFTPPGSDSGSSAHAGGNLASSQESHLFQLSQLAAVQQKMAEADSNGASKKRKADGMVKHTRDSSSTSPVKYGHSRNTSAVSMASTTGSRIGELSAELRTKLSYAMVKVNNGWQSHSIAEVESLASQAGSPTSSTSTLPGRHGTSASPRLSVGGLKSGHGSTATSPAVQYPPAGESLRGALWKEGGARPRSSTSPAFSQVPTLAPPAAIQPRQSGQSNPRRNSNARYTPAYLSHANQNSPYSPNQPGSLQSTPAQSSLRTPVVDPILFSPHQNVREQEALETLVFMSSPGNSANLKNQFPSSQTSQPRSSGRTALPTSRLGPGGEGGMRKSLPTGRPQHQPVKRVGFEASPSNVSDMDVDDAYGSPQVRGTPRRRANGSSTRPSLSMPTGLSGPPRPRRTLKDDDIERMLDRVAADDSSDSEGEISFPQRRRTEGTAGVGV